MRRRELLQATGICSVSLAGCTGKADPEVPFHREEYAQQGAWPMAGHDAENSAHNPVKGPREAASVRRVYDDADQGDKPKLLGSTIPTGPTPVVVDGVAHFPGGSVRLSDGKVATTAGGGSERATPALAHGHVFRTTGRETTAIHMDRSKRRWAADVGHPVLGPIVTNETVLVSSRKRDTGVVALHPGDGDHKWTYPGALGFVSGVAVADDQVYVTEAGDTRSGEGRVTALDSKTGEVTWTKSLGLVSVGPVARSDSVFVGTEAGTLHAFDSNGSVRWRTAAIGGRQGFLSGRPALGNELLFAPANNADTSVAVDLESGDIAWEIDTGLTSGTPAVGADLVYIGTANGGIEVVSKQGERKWVVETPRVTSGLALLEGRIYFTSGTALYEVA